MAIYRLPPQSHLDKKITLLEKQLNLKVEDSQNSSVKSAAGDISYLYSDLKKITILSFAAIGLQLLIYFFGQQYLEKINLF